MGCGDGIGVLTLVHGCKSTECINLITLVVVQVVGGRLCNDTNGDDGCGYGDVR